MSLDEADITTRLVGSRLPVFQFDNYRRWLRLVRAQQDNVTPRRSRGELVLESDIASAAEVKVERLKGFRLERLAQLGQRLPPRISFLRAIAPGAILEISYEFVAVASDSVTEFLDRYKHLSP
jgi:hypothetical protein